MEQREVHGAIKKSICQKSICRKSIFQMTDSLNSLTDNSPKASLPKANF